MAIQCHICLVSVLTLLHLGLTNYRLTFSSFNYSVIVLCLQRIPVNEVDE